MRTLLLLVAELALASRVGCSPHLAAVSKYGLVLPLPVPST